MKTRDEQELEGILRSSKADIAKMLVNTLCNTREREASLLREIAVLKAELAGRDKVFGLLTLMAGEANLGLKLTR